MSKGISSLFKETKGSRKIEISRVGLIEEKPPLKSDNPKEPDFYVGQNSKVMLAEHKKWLGVSRRDSMLKKAKSKELKNAVDKLYRANSIVGDGSTATALIFEKSTGLNLAKHGSHLEKAEGMLRYLNKIIKKGAVPKGDLKLAIYLKKKTR